MNPPYILTKVRQYANIMLRNTASPFHEHGYERQCMMFKPKSLLFWLLAAFLSFLASVYLWFWHDPQQGLFVAIWVPSILSLGTLLNTMQRGK